MNQQSKTKHQIQVNPDDPDVVMEVTVKSLTFFDIQRAMQEMLQFIKGEAVFQFEAYWKHAFTHWIVDTNPSLTIEELLNLDSYIGDQIANILPRPDEMAGGGLGFRDTTKTGSKGSSRVKPKKTK